MYQILFDNKIVSEYSCNNIEELQFEPGDIIYHKATNKKCVVIKNNDDGTVKVRTSDNEEFDYYPVELIVSQSRVIKKDKEEIANMDKFTEGTGLLS